MMSACLIGLGRVLLDGVEDEGLDPGLEVGDARVDARAVGAAAAHYGNGAFSKVYLLVLENTKTGVVDHLELYGTYFKNISESTLVKYSETPKV